jgi:hypothetical protein
MRNGLYKIDFETARGFGRGIEATALAGKRSIRFRTVLRRLA